MFTFSRSIASMFDVLANKQGLNARTVEVPYGLKGFSLTCVLHTPGAMEIWPDLKWKRTHGRKRVSKICNPIKDNVCAVPPIDNGSLVLQFHPISVSSVNTYYCVSLSMTSSDRLKTAPVKLIVRGIMGPYMYVYLFFRDCQ